MSQPRVFEFAKEIGIETLSLMDKLRQWKIPVKNHMTELDEETLKTIRSHLLSETRKDKKKPQKKKPTKKKATTSGTKAKTSATLKKTTKKKVIRRKASDLPSAKQTYARVQKQLKKEANKKELEKQKALAESQKTSGKDKKAKGSKQTSKADVSQKDQGSPSQQKKTSDEKITGKAIIGEMDLGQTDVLSKDKDLLADASKISIATKEHEDKEKVAFVKTPKIQRDDSSNLFLGSEFRKREVIFQPKKKNLTLDRTAQKTQITTPAAHKRVVKLHGQIAVGDFAHQMQIKTSQLISTLIKNGVQANINSVLDYETASLIASEFQYETENVQKTLQELLNEACFGELDAKKTIRAPIVTVMGHIDHGKTTLLDAVRKTNVVSAEAGGITQHIGAYSVSLDQGKSITFIDTPGHEAFTAMRARGANITDIVVIVIAADDGIMPQTIEAIDHAKAAQIPIIIAVSKIDKTDGNIEKIRQEATKFDLVSEEWGGQTIFVPISAPKRQGISDLLETILLVSEMQDLKANSHRSGTGVVIEAEMKKGRGHVVTLLVQDGTISKGQYIVAGYMGGCIKSIMNDRGQRIPSAGPSMPVEVSGLDGSPAAGDRFDICKAESQVNEIIKKRKSMQTTGIVAPHPQMSLEDLFSKVKKEDVSILPLVIKTDVSGTGEAIKGAIKALFDKLSTKEVDVKIIHQAVGGISESDVLLATSAKGMVVGFNVRPDIGASQLAKKENVSIKTYKIIYDLIKDIEMAVHGLLTPTLKESIVGHLEVRNVFTISKVGTIAGCFVTDGQIHRNSDIRLLRESRVIYEGKVGGLKRFKDDIKEVASGFECGLSVENYNDIKVGDVIEVFKIVEVPKTLSS